MLSYKAYCIDLDGTIYRGKEPIKEAVEFVHYLQHNGIEPFFVTNNASMTQQQLQLKLAKMDIHIEANRIMTSAIAAAHFIDDHHKGKTVFMVGADGLKEALHAKEIVCTEAAAEVVVMGIDLQINYEKLATACLSIRAGAVFLSTNSDHAFPTERGFLPGNGAFTKLVEHSTGVEAMFMGKPKPYMLELIQQEHGYAKDEMIMIGDNYQTDILTGIHYGIHTAHINSGVTTTDDVRKQLELPTYLLESLSEWTN
ncbi:TIGR01457 family HAD-type hydrolase [Psychrobacillus sp.]|uniref:TIGR01457 family HAD-type hydrolase n=1 Tax=Psychrobacillus sp. TaxID=1871623 RepID=UPI0028BE9255|nr:TIGR01457 family HAD-type hydrolase [Psychrobacillus sp.]